jgi:hypothetical protein
VSWPWDASRPGQKGLLGTTFLRTGALVWGRVPVGCKDDAFIMLFGCKDSKGPGLAAPSNTDHRYSTLLGKAGKLLSEFLGWGAAYSRCRNPLPTDSAVNL